VAPEKVFSNIKGFYLDNGRTGAIRKTDRTGGITARKTLKCQPKRITFNKSPSERKGGVREKMITNRRRLLHEPSSRQSARHYEKMIQEERGGGGPRSTPGGVEGVGHLFSEKPALSIKVLMVGFGGRPERSVADSAKFRKKKTKTNCRHVSFYGRKKGENTRRDARKDQGIRRGNVEENRNRNAHRTVGGMRQGSGKRKGRRDH